MKINSFYSNFSNIAIASKDSSISEIDSAKISNVKYCLSAYKKKQEFNGSILKVNNLDCKNYYKKVDIDKNSILKIEKETSIN